MVKKLLIKPLMLGFSRFYMPEDGNQKAFKFRVSGAITVYKKLVGKQKINKVSTMDSVNLGYFADGFRRDINTNNLRWFFSPDFDYGRSVGIAYDIISFKSFKLFSVGNILNISCSNVLYAHPLKATIGFIFSNLKKLDGIISGCDANFGFHFFVLEFYCLVMQVFKMISCLMGFLQNYFTTKCLTHTFSEKVYICIKY
jgi:hypothetical protein